MTAVLALFKLDRDGVAFLVAMLTATAGVLTVKFTGTSWSSLTGAFAVVPAVVIRHPEILFTRKEAATDSNA